MSASEGSRSRSAGAKASVARQPVPSRRTVYSPSIAATSAPPSAMAAMVRWPWRTESAGLPVAITSSPWGPRRARPLIIPTHTPPRPSGASVLTWRLTSGRPGASMRVMRAPSCR